VTGAGALEQRLERVDGLVERIETATDPASSAAARELVQIVMELHGDALERIVALVRQTGETGVQLLERFARDQVVRSVLLLYDLHPDDPETRVREAVDRTRSYVDAQGGAVELIAVGDDGSAHLRVQGASTLTGVVEKAVREAAPDLVSVVVEHQPPLVVLERRR
jgi:Fe-S cluster biogenesis protein NfuA